MNYFYSVMLPVSDSIVVTVICIHFVVQYLLNWKMSNRIFVVLHFDIFLDKISQK